MRTHWHRTTDGALHRPGPLAAWQGWASGTNCLGDSRPRTFFKELLSQGCGDAIYLLRRKQPAVRKSPCPQSLGLTHSLLSMLSVAAMPAL